MNIPTAEEFAKTHHPMKTYPVDHQMMIEFAKLHVEAALLAALNNAEYADGNHSASGDLDEDSILNSYPLTNIK